MEVVFEANDAILHIKVVQLLCVKLCVVPLDHEIIVLFGLDGICDQFDVVEDCSQLRLINRSLHIVKLEVPTTI